MPEIKVDPNLCFGCRACALVCPEGVFDLVGDYLAMPVAPERCTACAICEHECPEDAITVR